MAAPSKGLLFLTGAPAASELSWDEQNCAAELGPRLCRYLGSPDENDAALLLIGNETETAGSHPSAKWRHIPFGDEENHNEAPKFLSFHDLDAVQPSQEHMNFLQHSLAVLQNIDSSQICALPEEPAYNETTFVSALSFTSDTSVQTSYGDSFSTNATGEPSQQVVSFSGPIMDLRRIPTARHLQSIHPQTMTVNVLASVISVQPTRTVRLRKRSGEMDIIEVLLGDETRAGFSVSFWVPPAASQYAGRSESKGGLKDVLAEVRSGDVLLITHIALGEFNGNVYGQSLSRRITRNNTSLVKLSEQVVGLSAPAMAKMKRVRQWAADFVGRPTKRVGSHGLETASNAKRRSILPPDTQPSFL